VRAALAFALALSGCASVHIYDYAPKPLPPGAQPLAVVEWSLHDLRNITWSYGEPDPDSTRRAEMFATPVGVAASPEPIVEGSPLDLSYMEIINGVRHVTQLNGLWTVYIYDRFHRLVLMEFSSYAAVRLFLDASYALARQT
jgi:hypothetical protein